jgi:hypothetical protein
MTADDPLEEWTDASVLGPFAMTNPYIPSHTRTTRLDSLTKMGKSISLSRPRKPGSSAQVAGMSFLVASLAAQTPCNRICPGRHFAVRMLCLTVARILSVFDILPPVDNDGRPRIPEAKYQTTLVR